MNLLITSLGGDFVRVRFENCSAKTSLISTTTTTSTSSPFCFAHGLVLYCSRDVVSRNTLSELKVFASGFDCHLLLFTLLRSFV